MAVVPGAVEAAWANRESWLRAARFLAGPAGIDQFLDRAGLPGAGAVHEAARAVSPQARVVCADNDPVVTVYAQAVLAGMPGVAVVEGDVRYPRALLSMREVRDALDLTRPVAVVLGDVLPFVSADDDPWSAVRCLTGLVAEGSYLVISHAAGDTLSTAAVQGVRRVYDDALASWTPRSLAEVTWFLAGDGRGAAGGAGCGAVAAPGTGAGCAAGPGVRRGGAGPGAAVMTAGR